MDMSEGYWKIKLKQIVFLFLVTLLITNSSCVQSSTTDVIDTPQKKLTLSFSQDQVLHLMDQVADWQLENDSRFHDLDWTNATFYAGLVDLAKLSDETKYFDSLMAIGEKYEWQPYTRTYVADDIAVSQMYLEMYGKFGNEAMLTPTKERTEYVISHPSDAQLYWGKGANSFDRWSWCDALFMAPPVYAQMYNITKEEKYLEFMDDEYHATYDLLYDKEEHLFFRDYRYLDKTEENGEKIFWGRGNGWVAGGLVKILKELPSDSQYRAFYENLFTQMCERISQLQDGNGFWHTSLLDTVAYPNPETSGSSFFVYALAYGINSDLLEREIYLPVVEKGWSALESAVYPDGKLGWVQPVGASPESVTTEMTEVYGVGAFLLAGCEVYSLCKE